MAESGGKPHKIEQVLIIEPKNVLHFKGPYNEVVTSHLRLTNPTDRRVCFKVKTTAPRRYCVRPNNGVVEPKSTTQIAVMLQPFDFENQPDRNKHKFMIQTMFEPEPDMDQEKMWRVYLDQVMDSKLKCVFDNPPDSGKTSAPSGGNTNVYSNAETAPELFSSQTSETAKFSSSAPENEEPETFATALKPANERNFEVSRLLEDCKRLKEENSSLRQELMQVKEEGLKRRYQAESSSGSKAMGDTPGFKGPSAKVGPGDQMNILAQPQVIGLLLVALIFGLFVGKVIF